MTEESDEPDVSKLKFHEKHVEPILAGRKTVTLRVGEIDLEIGDRFQFLTEDGERFASGHVYDRGWTTIEMAAMIDWDGHRNYKNTDELLEELNEYYPNEELNENTPVEIVYWNWGDIWE